MLVNVKAFKLNHKEPLMNLKMSQIITLKRAKVTPLHGTNCMCESACESTTFSFNSAVNLEEDFQAFKQVACDQS